MGKRGFIRRSCRSASTIKAFCDQSCDQRPFRTAPRSVHSPLACGYTSKVVELLRRYSRHQNVTVRLQKVYGRASKGGRKPRLQDERRVSRPQAVVRRLGSSSVVALIRSYEAGATTAQLAEQYSVSATAVKDLLHRAGVAVRRSSGLNLDDVSEATRLYESGWLLREIAQKFDVSQEDVRRKLLASGVVMRSGHGDHGQRRR